MESKKTSWIGQKPELFHCLSMKYQGDFSSLLQQSNLKGNQRENHREKDRYRRRNV